MIKTSLYLNAAMFEALKARAARHHLKPSTLVRLLLEQTLRDEVVLAPPK